MKDKEVSINGRCKCGRTKQCRRGSTAGGDAVETIVEELRQEKNTLIEMKNFMIKLLELMQKSADAFEETDISYKEAVQNLGQGETD